MKHVWVCLMACLLFSALVSGGTFTNGGFETGDFSGWTQGGGYWGSPFNAGQPVDYLPGGSRYTPGYAALAVVGPGTDPIVGVNTVYNGNYSARINDWNNNYSVSVISQTVTNYTDPQINFEWAAVLEGSHGVGDSDYFALQLTDNTKGDTLYSVSYDSASTPGYFTAINGWYSSGWQVQTLNLAADRIGDTFTLTVLGSDCPYGGHAGYVYVDGFDSVVVPQGTVPEPATFAMTGLGALVLGFVIRRRRS